MTEPNPNVIPPELYADLVVMHPSSYEFKSGLGALNDLAKELGEMPMTALDIHKPEALTPPNGYTSNVLVKDGAVVPIDQFEGRIHSLRSRDEEIEVDAQRLVTDSGKEVTLVDLRSHMTTSVIEGGPTEKGQADALDRAVYRDVKFMLETGHPSHRVKGVRGINYTRLGDTKIRAYWTEVETQDTGRTVARLADCSNSVAAEAQLYRRVFDRKL